MHTCLSRRRSRVQIPSLPPAQVNQALTVIPPSPRGPKSKRSLSDAISVFVLSRQVANLFSAYCRDLPGTI